MEESQHKTLNFSKVELSNSEWNKINNLFEKYSEEDIFYELDEKNFSVHLKNLNFKEFEKDVKSVTGNGLINTKGAELLENILSKIESIKSYGLKGNKRVYVDYNKERKVKNRKQKEKNRQQFFYAQSNKFSKINNQLPEKYIDQIIWEKNNYNCKYTAWGSWKSPSNPYLK